MSDIRKWRFALFTTGFAGTAMLVAAMTASADDGTPRTSEITLPDIHGESANPLTCDGKTKAAVVIFIAVDCPIANGYAPEIARIVKEYAAKGVAFTLAHVDPDLEDADAAKHAEEYGLDQGPAIVVDRQHALVKAGEATITPEAAVFSPDGKLVYRGRINDLYTGFGDRRNAASEHDLRDALDAVLAGKAVKVARTKAVGCLIEPL